MDARIPVSDEDMMLALKKLSDGLQRRVKEKGRGSFIGLHEIDGVMDEEVREFKGEIHADDRMAAMDEMIDIGVTSLFGIASVSAIVRDELARKRAAEKRPGA